MTIVVHLMGFCSLNGMYEVKTMKKKIVMKKFNTKSGILS